MREVKNQTFQNTRLILDDTHFVECRFDSCELVYEGGEYWKLTACNIVECKLRLGGAAKNTLHLLRQLYNSPNEFHNAFGIWAVNYIKGNAEPQ